MGSKAAPVVLVHFSSVDEKRTPLASSVAGVKWEGGRRNPTADYCSRTEKERKTHPSPLRLTDGEEAAAGTEAGPRGQEETLERRSQMAIKLVIEEEGKRPRSGSVLARTIGTGAATQA